MKKIIILFTLLYSCTTKESRKTEFDNEFESINTILIDTPKSLEIYDINYNFNDFKNVKMYEILYDTIKLEIITIPEIAFAQKGDVIINSYDVSGEVTEYRKLKYSWKVNESIISKVRHWESIINKINK